MAKNDLQGALDLLVLKTLWLLSSMHGYSIVMHIRRVSGERIIVEEGSLHPALHRMEQTHSFFPSFQPVGLDFRGILDRKTTSIIKSYACFIGFSGSSSFFAVSLEPTNEIRRLAAIYAEFAPPSLGRSERNPVADSVGFTQRRLVLRLLNGENLVTGNIVQHLTDPAWPTDFNIFDSLGTTQAKVHPIIT
jgi:hypothetical protein